MAVKFLDNTGLGYFWSKIKAWCNATFAAITHNQASNTINAMTGYSKPSSGSAIAASDSLNSAIGKLEAKVDAVDQSNVVHKTGDEVISGSKYFNDYIRIKKTATINNTETTHDSFITMNSSSLWFGAYDTTNDIWSWYIDPSGNSYFKGNADTASALVSAGDNVASTSTDTYSLGAFNVRWFSETDKLPGQPSQYGFLATFGSKNNAAEVHQIFCVQPNGDLYHRGTNSSSYTSPPAFKKIIDSSNETQLSLTTSGSGNAITALSVSNHEITATKGTTFLTSHQDISGKVSKSGDTMTGNLVISNAAALKFKQTNMVRGTAPSANRYPFYIILQDNNENTCGGLYYEYNTNKQARSHLMCYKGTTNDNTWNSIGVGYDNSGNVFTWAPTPATADNTTKIATTAFVKAQGYLTSHQTLPTLSVASSGSGNAVTNITVSAHKITFTKGSTFLTSHQSLDGCVKTSGAQTVNGVKTFTNWPIVLHNGPGVNLKDQDFVHTTASNHPSCSIQAQDKNGIMCGEFLFHDYANGNTQRAWSVYIRPSSSNTANMISYHFYQGNDVVFVPGADNKYHFGTNSSRWAQFHAGTSSIATSDEREKTVLNELSNDFYSAWDELNFCQYKFNDAIEEKGIDNARIHIGLIAQRIKNTFLKYDLDAHKYGFFCYDEWDEQQADVDKDGNILTPYKAAGNRYALRYEEALCIEAAYQRRKNKILENRISELERQVSDMLQILQNLTSNNG